MAPRSLPRPANGLAGRVRESAICAQKVCAAAIFPDLKFIIPRRRRTIQRRVRAFVRRHPLRVKNAWSIFGISENKGERITSIMENPGDPFWIDAVRESHHFKQRAHFGFIRQTPDSRIYLVRSIDAPHPFLTDAHGYQYQDFLESTLANCWACHNALPFGCKTERGKIHMRVRSRAPTSSKHQRARGPIRPEACCDLPSPDNHNPPQARRHRFWQDAGTIVEQAR